MTDTPYRPSSGTEGADFVNEMCCGCGHYRLDEPNEFDKHTGVYDCDLSILTGAFVYPIGAPEYPKEWVVRDGYPTCTAREEAS